MGLDTGLRITVTYSSNEIGTDVSFSTSSSSGMTVQIVSKFSILGARHIFSWTVTYRKTETQFWISERFLLHRFANLYQITLTLNLQFYYINLPSHYTIVNSLFALGLLSFYPSSFAVRKTFIVHPWRCYYAVIIFCSTPYLIFNLQ